MISINERIPFADDLLKYERDGMVSFHGLPVQNGSSVTPMCMKFFESVNSNVLSFQTAGTLGLDSLSYPSGPLLEAQEKIAEDIGATSAFLTTNGSTGAIHTAWQMAGISRDDIVICEDGRHKAHDYAAINRNANILCLAGRRIDEYGFIGPVRHLDIKEAMLDLKSRGLLARLKMIVVTSPTFDGLQYDFEKLLADIVAIKQDIIVFCDGAWGSVHPFHDMYRDNTIMRCAAKLALRCPDLKCIWTTSPHKGLSAFRGYGLLCWWHGKPLDEFAVGHARYANLSTSPNQVGLASAIVGLYQAAHPEGRDLITRSLEESRFIRNGLMDIGMPALDLSDLGGAGEDGTTLDPAKINFFTGRFLTGGRCRYELYRKGIQQNKTTQNTVLVLADIGTVRWHSQKLLASLAEISKIVGPNSLPVVDLPPLPVGGYFHSRFCKFPGILNIAAAYEMSLDILNCEYLTPEEIASRADKGEQVVCAEIWVTYPPGQPLLRFAQIISAEMCRCVRNFIGLRAEIHWSGPVGKIRVFTEKALSAG